MSRTQDLIPDFPPTPFYSPGAMLFDGSTGYYSNTYTASGNLVTGVCRFKSAGFTGDVVQYLMSALNTNTRLEILIISDDYTGLSDQWGKVRVTVRSSAGAILCRLYSAIAITDNEAHTLHFTFDGDSAAAAFRIDGINADDTGHASRTAPTAGTVQGGASTTVTIGASGAGGSKFDGHIGFCGYADAYLPDWQDFMHSDGTPRKLDDSGWTEFGGVQPLFFHPAGKMDENLGSAGDMTANGTIELAAQDEYIVPGSAESYQPALMEFDGSTGYYSITGVTTSGNKAALVMQFSRAGFTGDVYENLCLLTGPTRILIDVLVISDNHSTLPNRRGKIQITTKNSAGTNIAKLISSVTVTDAEKHTLFYEFDGDLGTAKFYIDGQDVDDTENPDRVAPTTGTLDTGAGSAFGVGATQVGATPFEGEIGFCGVDDSAGHVWRMFMDRQGNPRKVDESTWDAFGGSQPLFFNEHAQMSNNKGSAGDMTENGTIVVAAAQ